MYSPEQANQLQADSGEVHHLESRKTEVETYETFYRLYDRAALEKRGFTALLSRVIHIDETEDRSHHFVIAHANKPMPPIRRRFGHLRTPDHYVPYNPHDILVASTNGESIVEYDVMNAFGSYRAYLNNTSHPYDPANERVELSLLSDLNRQVITAEFNMATGNGMVHLDGEYCGWILSEQESTAIRERILQPEPVRELGHTALSS